MAKVPMIRVSKLDAARRQPDAAIKLWFADGDEVSVHTLAAAAHQTIHDINQKKGGGELLTLSRRPVCFRFVFHIALLR